MGQLALRSTGTTGKGRRCAREKGELRGPGKGATEASGPLVLLSLVTVSQARPDCLGPEAKQRS